jgi:hypothetical protein
VTADVWAEALTVDCGWCGMDAGMRCGSISGFARRPHKRRVRLARIIAGHNDPALDALWPKRGPCGLCGTSGLDQRHRVIDSIASYIAADQGDTDADLAEEFGVAAEAVAVVRAWAVRHPEAWS